MKHLFRSLLLNLPLFLAPVVLWGADAKPKTAGTVPPAGGATADQPVASQGPAESKPDTDADANRPKRPKMGARPTSIAIIPERGGLKTLTIHFRWSLFPNSSVEVRLLPDPEPKGDTSSEPKGDTGGTATSNLQAEKVTGVTVSPIYFAEHLKGTVRDALYTCLDHPGEGGRTHSFTKDKIVYKMIGRRNALGNQGVHVQVHAEDSKASDEYPAAAYLQLDTWAVDKETLSLDLDRDEFAKPGRIFVWFFRGDQVVWEEQLRWPGYR